MMLNMLVRLGLRRLPTHCVHPCMGRVLVRVVSTAKPPTNDIEYHDTEDLVHQATRFHDLSFVRSFHDEERMGADNSQEPPQPPESWIHKPTAFAVEGPDGISEAMENAELHHIDDMIQHAAQHEDKDFVKRLRQQQQEAARIYAVDAPDGESDDMVKTEIAQVDAMIYEDPLFVKRRHQAQQDAAKIFAVDGPDGLPDDVFATKGVV